MLHLNNQIQMQGRKDIKEEGYREGWDNVGGFYERENIRNMISS